MAWDSKWPSKVEWPAPKQEESFTIIYPATPEWPATKYDGMVTVVLPKDSDNAKIILEAITKDIGEKAVKEFNQIPTHDPYTNPNAYLYYECSCGKRLDPHTKRFAELNNAAMKAGWKIRWGAEHYVSYCVECGKDVE